MRTGAINPAPCPLLTISPPHPTSAPFHPTLPFPSISLLQCWTYVVWWVSQWNAGSLLLPGRQSPTKTIAKHLLAYSAGTVFTQDWTDADTKTYFELHIVLQKIVIQFCTLCCFWITVARQQQQERVITFTFCLWVSERHLIGHCGRKEDAGVDRLWCLPAGFFKLLSFRFSEYAFGRKWRVSSKLAEHPQCIWCFSSKLALEIFMFTWNQNAEFPRIR